VCANAPSKERIPATETEAHATPGRDLTRSRGAGLTPSRKARQDSILLISGNDCGPAGNPIFASAGRVCALVTCSAGAVPRGGRLCQAELQPKAELIRSDSAARVPFNAFELPRASSSVLSRRRVSLRAGAYTRGERPGTSAGSIPGRSIGGRDAALRQRCSRYAPQTERLFVVRANAPSKVKGFQRRRLTSTPGLAGISHEAAELGSRQAAERAKNYFLDRAAPLYASNARARGGDQPAHGAGVERMPAARAACSGAGIGGDPSGCLGRRCTCAAACAVATIPGE
jgi:hypothetical protein